MVLGQHPSEIARGALTLKAEGSELEVSGRGASHAGGMVSAIR